MYPQKKEVEKNIEKVCKEKNCELIKVEDNLINIEIEIIEKKYGAAKF